MKIAIIGKGNVGQALAGGLSKAGHEIRFGTKEPKEPVKEAAEWAEVIILAVPWTVHKDVANALGTAVDGKAVVDVSNILTSSFELALGFTTSGAEELQKLLPKSHIVKAFNTVFAQNMKTGRLGGERLAAFVACDDDGSKKAVQKLAEDIGFEAVDAGTLKSARYLEPMGMINITLGYGLKMGTGIGLRLVKGE
ncbi:NADPH-dependent F420 reductase [Candidatus Woesearchaeota archaeon]|nr:NADPH-dependent F420 reductase [Candidatus Woesearchaeota archaeon]